MSTKMGISNRDSTGFCLRKDLGKGTSVIQKFKSPPKLMVSLVKVKHKLSLQRP